MYKLTSVVVGNDVVGGPRARSSTFIIQSGLVNLEELESSLINVGEVAVNGSKVVENRTVVRFWPCVPLNVDALACSDWNAGKSWCSTLVTNDIAVAKSSWVDEAVVLIVGVPSSGVRLFRVVKPFGCCTSIPLSIGNNATNVAVSRDRDRESDKDAGRFEERHDVEFGDGNNGGPRLLLFFANEWIVSPGYRKRVKDGTRPRKDTAQQAEGRNTTDCNDEACVYHCVAPRPSYTEANTG